MHSELSKWQAAQLKKTTSNFIPYLKNEGSPEYLLKFILSAKFRGKNAFVAIEVWKDFVIDSFNLGWKHDKHSLNKYGFRASYLYRSSKYCHSIIEYGVEEKYCKLITKINPSDYEQAISISPNLFLENNTRAFRFVVIPYVLSHSEVLEWHQDRLDQLDNASVAKTDFEIEEPRVWKPSTEFSSGKLEYTSGFQLIFGSLETLIEHLPDLEKITVGRYTAQRGGKDTTIRSYIKRKPTRNANLQDDPKSKIE